MWERKRAGGDQIFRKGMGKREKWEGEKVNRVRYGLPCFSPTISLIIIKITYVYKPKSINIR